MRRVMLTASVAAIILVIVGCGSSSTPTPSPTTRPPLAQQSTPGPTATAIKLVTVAKKYYRVNGTGGSGLNIRQTPDVAGEIVARACENAVLEAEGEPVRGGDYTWIKIVGYGYAADAYLLANTGPATANVTTENGLPVVCPAQ